jgi:hypothetical protein
MLPYPDRFRFKSAPPRASRLMFLWFVFLLLVAVLSVGMLVTAIMQAAETGQTKTWLPKQGSINPLSLPIDLTSGFPLAHRKISE